VDLVDLLATLPAILSHQLVATLPVTVLAVLILTGVLSLGAK
jgi:hypothetical protein